MSDSDSLLSSLPYKGYRELVDNLPNGVLVLFDANLCYRIVGPDVLPSSERKAAEITGKTISELFPPDTATELKPELDATIAGEARSFDIEFRDEIHHIETHHAEIDDEPFGVLVSQTVTDEREVAQTLEEQNERLDHFASIISHDLQNSLNIALGRLDIYQTTSDETHLTAVEEALERIEDVVTDLSALARHDTQSSEYQPVSLGDIAKDAWEMIDTPAATLCTKKCTIVGDASQLQALLENLFRNAISHGGKEVTVHVGPLESGFFVEDTGTGIPSEIRDNVFEHGFTMGDSGSGVGLTIVERIASVHDLQVSLTESTEGGARFEFRTESSEK